MTHKINNQKANDVYITIDGVYAGIETCDKGTYKWNPQTKRTEYVPGVLERIFKGKPQQYDEPTFTNRREAKRYAEMSDKEKYLYKKELQEKQVEKAENENKQRAEREHRPHERTEAITRSSSPAKIMAVFSGRVEKMGGDTKNRIEFEKYLRYHDKDERDVLDPEEFKKHYELYLDSHFNTRKKRRNRPTQDGGMAKWDPVQKKVVWVSDNPRQKKQEEAKQQAKEKVQEENTPRIKEFLKQMKLDDNFKKVANAIDKADTKEKLNEMIRITNDWKQQIAKTMSQYGKHMTVGEAKSVGKYCDSLYDALDKKINEKKEQIAPQPKEEKKSTKPEVSTKGLENYIDNKIMSNIKRVRGDKEEFDAVVEETQKWGESIDKAETLSDRQKEELHKRIDSLLDFLYKKAGLEKQRKRDERQGKRSE